MKMKTNLKRKASNRGANQNVAVIAWSLIAGQDQEDSWWDNVSLCRYSDD
jgi:hypothetical protein